MAAAPKAAGPTCPCCYKAGQLYPVAATMKDRYNARKGEDLNLIPPSAGKICFTCSTHAFLVSAEHAAFLCTGTPKISARSGLRSAFTTLYEAFVKPFDPYPTRRTGGTDKDRNAWNAVKPITDEAQALLNLRGRVLTRRPEPKSERLSLGESTVSPPEVSPPKRRACDEDSRDKGCPSPAPPCNCRLADEKMQQAGVAPWILSYSQKVVEGTVAPGHITNRAMSVGNMNAGRKKKGSYGYQDPIFMSFVANARHSGTARQFSEVLRGRAQRPGEEGTAATNLFFWPGLSRVGGAVSGWRSRT